MAELAKNSTIDISRLTEEQLAAMNAKFRDERQKNIEGFVSLQMLTPPYRQLVFFAWAGYVTELWLLKGAFLAFYWRLFCRVQSRFVYLLYGTSFLCCVTYIIVITIHFTWCTPVHRNWTSTLEEFPRISSINSLTTLTIGSFLNIGTDIMIIILPLLIIRTYNLQRKEVFGLCFIFTVGIMCITASIVRYVVMYTPYKSPPATMEGVRTAFFWTTLEIVTGFIAFCLPSFRIIFLDLVKRGRSVLSKGHPSGLGNSSYSKGSKNSIDYKKSGNGTSGSKGRKKPLPRHPNTLLTEDFITLNTLGGNDLDEELAIFQTRAKSPSLPTAAVTRDNNAPAHVGIIPEPHNEEPPNWSLSNNGIQVTNTVSITSYPAGPAGLPTAPSPHFEFPPPTAASNSSNGSFSNQAHSSLHQTTFQYTYENYESANENLPMQSFAASMAAATTASVYGMGPIQRAYDPASAHAGSKENLRPTEA
ncbi:hypothetical protein BDZ91DRAFT_762839 [Kalaharituber pfeilii]|nr:hypothetical protein BDZ91DRAFT_762839 [Kalaharituber pfeilii]